MSPSKIITLNVVAEALSFYKSFSFFSMNCNKIPKTSLSKFFSNEAAAGLFNETNYDGKRMTFKGFLNQVSINVKLVANARELNEGRNSGVQTLLRTHRFFTAILQYIRYKNISGNLYDSVRSDVEKKFLERIEKKYSNTTTSAGDETDFEISDDEAPGTLLWGDRNKTESFSNELKDFHECILDVLIASIDEVKMEEIWFKAALKSYDIPQKFCLNKKINIMILIWEEFAKVGDDSDVPSHPDITWENVNLHHNWRLFKVDIEVTGYLLQYPENLTKVIDSF